MIGTRKTLLAAGFAAWLAAGCGEGREVKTELSPEQMEMLRQMEQPQPMPENLRRVVEERGRTASPPQQ